MAVSTVAIAVIGVATAVASDTSAVTIVTTAAIAVFTVVTAIEPASTPIRTLQASHILPKCYSEYQKISDSLTSHENDCNNVDRRFRHDRRDTTTECAKRLFECK